MDFPIATQIPYLENSFWIYLPDSIITVDVIHRQPTPSLEALSLSHKTLDWRTIDKGLVFPTAA